MLNKIAFVLAVMITVAAFVIMVPRIGEMS